VRFSGMTSEESAPQGQKRLMNGGETRTGPSRAHKSRRGSD